MARIERIITATGLGGWYSDDKAALLRGAREDGYFYAGSPLTPGFGRIREPGRSLGVLFLLDTGAVVWGDAVSVTYAGIAGRDSLFLPEREKGALGPFIEGFQGASLEAFKPLMRRFHSLLGSGNPLHTALKFGFTKGLLWAVAAAKARTVTEVVAEEYGTSPARQMVPLLIQSGADRYNAVDKGIMKRVEFLPHGLITTVERFGARGELLLEYARWVRERVLEKREPGYTSCIHFDLYGTAGLAFEDSPQRMAGYLGRLEEAVSPFQLYVESPVELGEQGEQIEVMASLKEALRRSGARVRLIADEWCNTLEDLRRFAAARACDLAQIKMPDMGAIDETIEAILACQGLGLEAYLGGSCNETEESARLTSQIGLATSPRMMLAKPGMGVDEGVMIMRNEMARTLAILQARSQGYGA